MLASILGFSTRNPWTVLLFTLLIAAVGVNSLGRLPIDAVPDITNNQVVISTVYPALSPVEVEKQITFPVETALAGIPGLDHTRSFSRNGFSQVTAVFDDDLDIYFARNQVNERLSGVRESLPPGADPKMGPITTGLGEIHMWTVSYETSKIDGARDGEPGRQSDGSYLTPEGETLRTDLEKLTYLRTVEDWIIRPQMKGVKGVAGIDTIGGYVKQYHVQPDPMKLSSYGLTFEDVIVALERNNVSTGAGFVEHGGEAYLVRAAGRIENLRQIEEVPIGGRRGTPIRVGDVATVALGKEARAGSASASGEEVVAGTALMLIGENSRTVSAAVEARLTEINKSLPPGIVARTALNRTTLVNSTIETVRSNLTEGAVLVIVILFLMLGNIRAAILTAAAIPLAMLFTAIGMVRMKISGNLMSLGAIDFGIIVDGSVIVVENYLRILGERQAEHGRVLTFRERLDTMLEAGMQVRSAAAFGEAIIITVYLPVLTLTGVEGKMFQPMAATVIFALAGAFVLSLTFIPAAALLFINGRVSERENILIRLAKAIYEPSLRIALRLRYLVVPAAAAAFVWGIGLYAKLGQEFVPTLDEHDIAMHAMRIPSTSLSQSTAMQTDVERAVSTVPEVSFVFSKTGTADLAGDPMPPNVSDTFIILKPREGWSDPSLSKVELIRRIETEIRKLPGNQYEFTQPIEMRFNELIAGVRGDVAVKVYGDDFTLMERTAKEIAGVLSGIEGAADVKVEQTEGLPVMDVDIDRVAAARHGLNVADVQDVVAAAIGGKDAGKVFEGDRRFDLVVRLPEAIRKDREALENLPIPLPHVGGGGVGESAPRWASLTEKERPARIDQGFVPLGSVARISVAEGPNQISRENGKRVIIVQANVRGRDLGSFVLEAQAIVERVKLPPAGWLEWGGQFENLEAARARLTVVVPVCFFLIFVLLLGSLHSVRNALLVFSGVPLGLTGGAAALWLREIPFSISAAVGFIALSGVAVLNGLVMVSFIEQLRKEGMRLEQAIIKGSLTRLRPVLMTALVASLGFVPMALARGTGAEVQKPLATVVIGGLISSTLLTLVVLPALYRMFAAGDEREAPDASPKSTTPSAPGSEGSASIAASA